MMATLLTNRINNLFPNAQEVHICNLLHGFPFKYFLKFRTHCCLLTSQKPRKYQMQATFSLVCKEIREQLLRKQFLLNVNMLFHYSILLKEMTFIFLIIFNFYFKSFFFFFTSIGYYF